LFAGVVSGGVALLAAKLAGSHSVIGLVIGGTAGLLVYAALAISPADFRQSLRWIRREQVPAVE
jgi:hypothetical protein